MEDSIHGQVCRYVRRDLFNPPIEQFGKYSPLCDVTVGTQYIQKDVLFGGWEYVHKRVILFVDKGICIDYVCYHNVNSDGNVLVMARRKELPRSNLRLTRSLTKRIITRILKPRLSPMLMFHNVADNHDWNFLWSKVRQSLV
jgi:hypothetical protein